MFTSTPVGGYEVERDVEERWNAIKLFKGPIKKHKSEPKWFHVLQSSSTPTGLTERWPFSGVSAIEWRSTGLGLEGAGLQPSCCHCVSMWPWQILSFCFLTCRTELGIWLGSFYSECGSGTISMSINGSLSGKQSLRPGGHLQEQKQKLRCNEIPGCAVHTFGEALD